MQAVCNSLWIECFNSADTVTVCTQNPDLLYIYKKTKITENSLYIICDRFNRGHQRSSKVSSIQTPLSFSSRCVEPASGGGGDLPGGAADEEVQAKCGVRSSALLRHVLHGVSTPAAAVRHQVRQHSRGWPHHFVQWVSTGTQQRRDKKIHELNKCLFLIFFTNMLRSVL